MNDSLPVPPELQHLIEKRQSRDRRKKARRKASDRRKVDLGPLGAIRPGMPLDALPLEERRVVQRRKKPDRRRRARRRDEG